MHDPITQFDRKKASPTQTVGVSGTVIYGGYIDEGEKNAALTGSKKYETYSNLLANNIMIATGIRHFVSLVSKAKWIVEPADDSKEAEELAERFDNEMHSMKTQWSHIVKRAAMSRFYGFSIQEWTAKKNDDGSIGFLDVAPRAQKTIEKWDTDHGGELLGVNQRSPQTQEEIYIPRWKMVYIVDDTLNDSPEGLGLFRHLINASARLSRYEQLESFGFETDLRGIPVARIPYAELSKAVEDGRITEEQKTAAIKPLKDFIKSHIKNPQLGIILDSLTYQSLDEAGTPSNVKQWDLELLSSQSTGQESVAKAIQRLSQEIARLLGVEGLLLGSTTNGSQALSVDKSKNLALSVDSALHDLSYVFERDFRDVLWSLNGWNEDLKPKLKTEVTHHKNIAEITSALTDLASAGAPLFPGDPAINETRDLLGLSNQPEFDMDEDASLISSPKKDVEDFEEEEE